jgi:hypothetical protein
MLFYFILFFGSIQVSLLLPLYVFIVVSVPLFLSLSISQNSCLFYPLPQKLFYPHDFFNCSANERTGSSETSVHIYQTIQRHIPPKTPVFNDGGIVCLVLEETGRPA